MARTMQATFLVMAGGAIGAAMRYHAQLLAAESFGARWPWGTLLVNAAGALFIGALAGWLAGRGAGEQWRLFLGVGLLGGFTTFSAFSLEVWQMAESGAWVSAAAYVLASLAVTVLLVGVGLAVARAVLA